MKNIQLSVEQARELLGKNPEIDKIIRANFTEEELFPKPTLPKSWEELRTVDGYFINPYSAIVEIGCLSTYCFAKNTFATEKQAQSALAMAQLSQLIKVYNGGWVADYNDNDQPKYAIIRYGDKLKSDYFYDTFNFISLRTSELRDEFLKNFEPLIKQYFEL